LEEKIDKYIVTIPKIATKEDLLDLKEFLANLDTGEIKIFIDLR